MNQVGLEPGDERLEFSGGLWQAARHKGMPQPGAHGGGGYGAHQAVFQAGAPHNRRTLFHRAAKGYRNNGQGGQSQIWLAGI